MKTRILLTILGLCFVLAACDFDGGVEQGRCVAYNPETNKVTLVVDTSLDQHDPHYSGEVDTFTLPTDPRDMGPAPVPGGLLMVEQDKNKVLVYDQAANKVREIDVKFTDIQKDITSKDARLKGKKFPIIDKENRTVTVFVPRLAEIVTFQVPEADIDLSDYEWTLGDEVRIAFRKEKRHQAIRFMNVTKTSIFTR